MRYEVHVIMRKPSEKKGQPSDFKEFDIRLESETRRDGLLKGREMAQKLHPDYEVVSVVYVEDLQKGKAALKPSGDDVIHVTLVQNGIVLVDDDVQTALISLIPVTTDEKDEEDDTETQQNYIYGHVFDVTQAFARFSSILKKQIIAKLSMQLSKEDLQDMADQVVEQMMKRSGAKPS